MGAVNPSKLHKSEKPIAVKKGGKVKKFSGKDDESLVEDLSNTQRLANALRGKLQEPPTGDYGPMQKTDMYGNPMMPAPDISEMPQGVSYMPQFAEFGKKNKIFGGRLSAAKNFDDNARLEGYLDVNASHDDRGLRGRGTGIGFNFIKQFKKGGKARKKK